MKPRRADPFTDAMTDAFTLATRKPRRTKTEAQREQLRNQARQHIAQTNHRDRDPAGPMCPHEKQQALQLAQLVGFPISKEQETPI